MHEAIPDTSGYGTGGPSSGCGTLRQALIRKALACDLAIGRRLHRLNRSGSRVVMRGFTALGSERFCVPAAIALGALAWLAGERRGGAVLALTALGTSKLIHVLKAALYRTRPGFSAEIRRLRSSSFPSGHTIAGIAIYGVAADVLTRLAPGTRTAATVIVATLATMIALSRVALGAHWTSDVLAGLGIGLVILILAILALGN